MFTAIDNKEPVIKQETRENSTNNQFYVPPAKTQRMKETIKVEIGQYWRTLARNLKIREFEIENIDIKHQRTEDKVKEMLELYFERSDKQRWFYVLCEALEKSRRKDLSKSIQQIMVMNI